MKKSVLALTIAVVLVGCGTSDETKSTDTGNTNSGDKPTSNVGLSAEMAKVTLQDIGTISECGITSQAFSTADLNVAYDAGATQANIDDLKNAARLSQVALDELVSKSGLDKSTSELNITANNKWTVCFDDNKTGNGSGDVRKLVFSPKDFSDDGYILAKHELFHVFQSALVNNEQAYMHLPFWFQEASAERFAGRNIDDVSATTLTRFVDVTNMTPLNILSWNNEQTVKTTHGNFDFGLYDIYQKSLEYFVSHGLTDTKIIELTRASYRNGQDAVLRPAFNDAMELVVFDTPLPATYNELRDDVNLFKQHVITDWLANAEYSATFSSVAGDVQIGKLMFESINSDLEFSGMVNSAQTSYAYNKGTLADGDYNIYAINVADTAVYGPIQQTVTNGELGPIDFAGQSLCTNCDD